MTTTLSVDPGRNTTGYAYFVGTRLVSCGLSVLPETGPSGRWKLGQIAEYHAKQIMAVCCDGYDVGGRYESFVHVDRVYVEEMSLNKGRDGTLSKAIATANDLLQLQSVGAFIAGRLGGELVYVPPAKHDKKVTQNRVVATLHNPTELMIVNTRLMDHKPSLHHNLYDAVLHGLRAVGRYG